jgi:hypothetical protein
VHATAPSLLLNEVGKKFIGSRLAIIKKTHAQASRRKLKKTKKQNCLTLAEKSIPYSKGAILRKYYFENKKN